MENCEHTALIRARFKDLILDTNQGERAVTIYIEHCEECGEIFNISQK